MRVVLDAVSELGRMTLRNVVPQYGTANGFEQRSEVASNLPFAIQRAVGVPGTSTFVQVRPPLVVSKNFRGPLVAMYPTWELKKIIIGFQLQLGLHMPAGSSPPTFHEIPPLTVVVK
jgi:hypothetical protein